MRSRVDQLKHLRHDRLSLTPLSTNYSDRNFDSYTLNNTVNDALNYTLDYLMHHTIPIPCKSARDGL